MTEIHDEKSGQTLKVVNSLNGMTLLSIYFEGNYMAGVYLPTEKIKEALGE